MMAKAFKRWTSPSASRATLWPWYIAHALAAFLTTLTSNAVYFFAGYELHTSVQVRLAMAAVAGLIYGLTAFVGGRMVDKFGRRRVGSSMAIACIAICFLGAEAVSFHNLAGLFIFLVLLNGCLGPLWPAIESAIARCPGNMSLSRRMALYNLNWSGAGFIAVCVLGTLASWLSWAGVFFIAAVMSIVVWFIIARRSDPQIVNAASPVAAIRKDQRRNESKLQASDPRKILHIAWLSNMLAFVAANTVTPFMPTITLALGVKSYALATALASIASLACLGGFIITIFWTSWHYQIRWTIIPFLTLTVGAVSMLLSQSPLMYAFTQILYGLSVALLYSGSIYYSLHLGSGAAAKAGIHEGLIGAAAALGPALIAVTGAPEAVEPKAWALLLVLGVGGSLMSYWARRAYNGKRAER